MNRIQCLITISAFILLCRSSSGDDAVQADIGPAPLPVYGLAFNSSGTLLAAAAGDREMGGGNVTVWNTENWHVVFTHEHTSSVNCIAFSPDGEWLFAGTQSGEALLFDGTTWELRKQWQSEQSAINGACWTPDGAILTAGSDGRVKQWNAVTGELQRTFDTWQADGLLGTDQQPQDEDGREREQRQLWDVAVSHNGHRLVSGGWNDTARLWDFETGEHLLTFASTQTWVQGVAFTSDDSHFISVGGEIVIRETEGGLERAALRISGRDVSVHPESQLLAAATYDGIRIYELTLAYPTAEEFEQYQALIARLEDDDIAVRDATSEQIAEVGLPIEPLLYEAIYSPYAETRMRCRELWNQVRSPEPLLTLEAHSGEPRQVTFSPDGRMLASSSKGGDVLIWSVPEFELLQTHVIERAP